MLTHSIHPKPCPVCKNSHLEVFFELLQVPIYCNLLLPDRDSARNQPRGDIRLGFCPNCGFISNIAFDPSYLDYTEEYENSLHYSPRFQKYAEALAKQLVEHYDLHDKNIIEIGCGKGDFLVSLCELGNNRGIGFDPTYVSREDHRSLGDRVKFVRDFYSERYQNDPADLVVCRHALEHVPHPRELLDPLRKAIDDRLDTAIFFEVPNSLYIFRNLAVWDIIYEHCCYYVPTSLSHAFVHHGFQVDRTTETFGGQFLSLEARPSADAVGNNPKAPEKVAALSRDIATFTTGFDNLLAHWQQKLAELANSKKRTVVWSAGSKGVTFLNLLQVQDLIEYVVDINPRKQGMYITGTGQKIVPPEFLVEYQPDVVIVMNPIYLEEIQEMTKKLGVECEFLCI